MKTEEAVIFRIVEYDDGKYKIETQHMAFHFREMLHYDNLNADQVVVAMSCITERMNNQYGCAALFEME